ncbi:MAG: polysaccharide biosynthesis tyrosine autokinase, partial [Phycisphaerales bacterium]
DPNNYMIRNSERRLRALELEYEAKVDEIMRDNLHSSLKALTDSIARSESLIDELEGEYEEKDALMQALAANMSRYLEMEQQRDHLALTRDADIELIKEVNLMKARADSSRVAMTQPAMTPREKSFPKIEVIVPGMAVLVLGLMTGLLFLREVTDQRVKTASDLFVVPDARVLGVIPELDEDPTRGKRAEMAVLLSPRSVLAESYRQACALIDKAMSRMGHQTLLVVGGLPQAGTTTIVSNIAASAAASGRSVIVVDANFRRSRLAGAMGADGNAVGLGELLIEKAAIDDAIQTTESEIHVMSAGTPAHRIYERFNNGRFETVMAELRHRFDLIIVDAPPAVVAGDAMVLANKVDAAIMVVRAYQEQRGLVARVMNQLVDARCEMLGMILNRPRGTAGGYFKKNFDAMARYADEPQT